MIENQATISLLLKELINGKRELEINLFHFPCVSPCSYTFYVVCAMHISLEKGKELLPRDCTDHMKYAIK